MRTAEISSLQKLLSQELLSWDGKSTAAIKTIYQRYYQQASFLTVIITQIASPKLEIGASWLLKHHLTEGYELGSAEIKNICHLLPQLNHWQTHLNLLQCIPHRTIAKTEKSLVETFLRDCLSSENKFVRAWAYNGFYELSLQYPEYKQETLCFFEMALKDEAASVKARIRNIMKKKDFGL